MLRNDRSASANLTMFDLELKLIFSLKAVLDLNWNTLPDQHLKIVADKQILDLFFSLKSISV